MKPVGYLRYYPSGLFEVERDDKYRRYGGLSLINGEIKEKYISLSSRERIAYLLNKCKLIHDELLGDLYLYCE